jgi:hypothetical protein
MWHESESRTPDYTRLANLVRSQIFFSLADEPQATWLSLEQDLLESDYAVIRERQMEMLEKEDGMMLKEGVRSLREAIGREAYEVLSDQRYDDLSATDAKPAEKAGSDVCCRVHGSTLRLSLSPGYRRP